MKYFKIEEFNCNGDTDLSTDPVCWVAEGRTDIATHLTQMLSDEIVPPRASDVAGDRYMTHTACGPRFDSDREWEDQLGLPSNLQEVVEMVDIMIGLDG